MFEILQLVKELDAYLRGVPVNFTKLRKTCREFNSVVKDAIKTDGTDEQLWESVTTYFPKLPKA